MKARLKWLDGERSSESLTVRLRFGRLLIILAVSLAVLSVVLWLVRPLLINIVLRQAAMQAGVRFDTTWLDDGDLHVYMCGTSPPGPDPNRAQSCVALIAGGAFVVIDAGSGSAARIDLANLPVASLNAVFITHYHSDHYYDIPALANNSWRYGRREPLMVYGPTGTQVIMEGFTQAMALDIAIRALHNADNTAIYAPADIAYPVGQDVTPPPFGESKLIYEHPGGLRIYAFRVDHAPVEPAFGYRAEYRGRVVTVSGDTRYNPNIELFAQDADILIHEAFNKNIITRMIAVGDGLTPETRAAFNVDSVVWQTRKAMSYHSDPLEAAQLAENAGVDTLVLTHIVPPLGSGLPRRLITQPLFLKGVKDVYSGEVIIAEDDMHFVLEPSEP